MTSSVSKLIVNNGPSDTPTPNPTFATFANMSLVKQLLPLLALLVKVVVTQLATMVHLQALPQVLRLRHVNTQG